MGKETPFDKYLRYPVGTAMKVFSILGLGMDEPISREVFRNECIFDSTIYVKLIS